MDRWTAMVVIAHARLRLTIIEKYRLLEGIDDMDIKRPMELAGLKSRLARAKKTEADIEATGRGFDAVLDQIDELHGSAKNHLGHLELHKDELRNTIEGMIAGSNGGPNDGEDAAIVTSDAGQVSGQVITSTPHGNVV